MATKTKQVTLQLEDLRAHGFEHDHFRVQRMTNTVEWKVGQYLTENEVKWILKRPQVKVDIIEERR